MKATQTCPNCACRRLYVVDVHQVSPDGAVFPMAVTAANVEPARIGLPRPRHASERHRTVAGRFETWVCSACGLTEWYAVDACAALDALSGVSGGNVRVVDARPPERPYR